MGNVFEGLFGASSDMSVTVPVCLTGDALNRRQQRDSVCGLPELPANKRKS